MYKGASTKLTDFSAETYSPEVSRIYSKGWEKKKSVKNTISGKTILQK